RAVRSTFKSSLARVYARVSAKRAGTTRSRPWPPRTDPSRIRARPSPSGPCPDRGDSGTFLRAHSTTWVGVVQDGRQGRDQAVERRQPVADGRGRRPSADPVRDAGRDDAHAPRLRRGGRRVPAQLSSTNRRALRATAKQDASSIKTER